MQPQNVPDPYASQSKKSMFALGIGAGVLVALLIFGGGLYALGLMGPKPVTALSAVGQQQSVLPAMGNQESVLPTIPIAPEPALPKPQEAIGMPDDIYNWLEHLRKTEELLKREVLAETSELQVVIVKSSPLGGLGSVEQLTSPDDMPDPRKEIANSQQLDIEKTRNRHEEIKQFFLSMPPPSECVPIQASYVQGLGETKAMMLEMYDIFARISSSEPDELVSMLTEVKSRTGNSTDRIDVLRKQSDEQVYEICRKYETRKWFTITPDIGGMGGGFLGKFGGF